jgi:Ca-activated chloride channel homolog
VLATLWARTHVDELMSQDFNGAQQGNMREDLKQAITQLGLDYRLMTQFTSFVAVEEMIVTDGGQPRRIDVPVEVPEGLNRESVFGAEGDSGNNNRMFLMAQLSPGISQSKTKARRSTAGIGGGTGGGYGPGRAGNVGGGSRSAGGGGGGSAAAMGTLPPPKPASSPMVIDAAMTPEVARTLSPEEQKRYLLQAKFHPSVLAVIDRLKDSKLAPAAAEAKFVRNGKAEVQIWLTDKSDETMAKLKELGFEVVLDPKTAKLVIGRLPIDKLAALVDLKSVRYVAPQTTSN